MTWPSCWPTVLRMKSATSGQALREEVQTFVSREHFRIEAIWMQQCKVRCSLPTLPIPSKYLPNTFQYPPIISTIDINWHIININEASRPLGLIWINTLLEIRFDNECRWPMMTLEQTKSYTSCLHICMRFDASHIGLSNSMGLIGLHLHSEIYQRLLRYPLFMLPLQCKLSRRYQPFLFLFWIYPRSSVVFFFFHESQPLG